MILGKRQKSWISTETRAWMVMKHDDIRVASNTAKYTEPPRKRWHQVRQRVTCRGIPLMLQIFFSCCFSHEPSVWSPRVAFFLHWPPRVAWQCCGQLGQQHRVPETVPDHAPTPAVRSWQMRRLLHEVPFGPRWPLDGGAQDDGSPSAAVAQPPALRHRAPGR